MRSPTSSQNPNISSICNNSGFIIPDGPLLFFSIAAPNGQGVQSYFDDFDDLFAYRNLIEPNQAILNRAWLMQEIKPWNRFGAKMKQWFSKRMCVWWFSFVRNSTFFSCGKPHNPTLCAKIDRLSYMYHYYLLHILQELSTYLLVY